MSWREIAELYQLTDWPEVELTPRYNIAPTQVVPVIVGEPRRGDMMGFGIPGAKSLLINARGETIDKRPAFRESFRIRRCLVPADGFYEWRKVGKDRQPYLFSLGNGEPFALAGIYDRDQFAILTTEANVMVAELHDRMPVVLSPDKYDDWLRVETSPEHLKAMLRPYAASEIRKWPVSRRVNKTAEDDAKMIEPIEEERELF